MDVWVQLVLSGVVGAAAGTVASLAAASRIARGSELGRAQEEARQRLVATVRRFRAQVQVDRADAAWRSAMEKEYLSADSGLAFAEAIEQDLLHAPSRLAKSVRVHLQRLVGPVEAHTARLAAPFPLAERTGEWRTTMYLSSAEPLDEHQIKDNGLLGAARNAQLVGEHTGPIIEELDAMERSINRARIGLRRR